MKGITSDSFLHLLYEQKLPEVYRDEDSKLGYPLKRYLQSLIEGGYYGIIWDIERLMFLIDPMTVPKELFPYLCESFGLPYFPDMDISFQRKFLANVGELNKRKGTYASVHHLVRALTGLESELSYNDGVLNIVLLAKNLEQLNNIEISIGVIQNYISSQLPYFVDTAVTSRLDNQIVDSKSYSHSAVGYYKFYKINKYEGGK